MKEWLEDQWYWLKRVPRNIKYWIAHRTYDKYHIVKTGMKPGYCDTVWRLPYVIFTLNEEFVEKELAADIVDWTYTPEDKQTYLELIQAYAFWKQFKDFEPYGDVKLDFIYRTKEYKERLAERGGDKPIKGLFGDHYTTGYFVYLHCVEEWYDKEVDRHCFNILKHRQRMWT